MQTGTIARAAFGAIIAAHLALAPTLASAAQGNNTPATAVVLSGTVSGDIAAAPPNLGSGREAFLTFQYPGDGSSVRVDVEITPGDLASASHAGFKIYGPTGGKQYAEGGQTGRHPSHEAEFSSTEAGTYLVEVFNYNVTPIHYQATATGLPPQPEATVQPVVATLVEPTATPMAVTVGLNVTADRPAELTGPVSAVLPGSAGGSSHFYRFDYPGDGSADRIDLDVTPSDAQTGHAVGFVVYGPTAGREYARGDYQGRTPTHSATLVSDEPGTYLVQVVSTNPAAVGYRLTLATPAAGG
jgi:hypothetical protein